MLAMPIKLSNLHSFLPKSGTAKTILAVSLASHYEPIPSTCRVSLQNLEMWLRCFIPSNGTRGICSFSMFMCFPGISFTTLRFCIN